MFEKTMQRPSQIVELSGMMKFSVSEDEVSLFVAKAGSSLIHDEIPHAFSDILWHSAFIVSVGGKNKLSVKQIQVLLYLNTSLIKQLPMD